MLFKWHFSKFSHMRKHKHGAFFHTFLFESRIVCVVSRRWPTHLRVKWKNNSSKLHPKR